LEISKNTNSHKIIEKKVPEIQKQKKNHQKILGLKNSKTLSLLKLVKWRNSFGKALKT
jgi:hypothetical protein